MHPLYDSLIFPWHLKPAKSFYDTLCVAYMVSNDIALMYRTCGAYVTELPMIDSALPGDQLWRDVLQKLAQKNKIRVLCENLRQSNPVPQVVDILGVIDALKSAVDPENVNINLVILDRHVLRGYMEMVAKDNDPVKVLLIRGTAKSGKTYSRHLFELMARQVGADILYLQSFVAPDLPSLLAELFRMVGDSNAIPETDTTGDAWYAKVCRKLLEIASAKNKNIWIAIDDLGYAADGITTIVARQVHEFIIQFVRHMSDPSFRKHFKLMLINYPDGKLASGWYKEHIKDERFTDQDINKAHIEEVITNWCKANNKNFLPADISSAAAKIISDVDSVVVDEDTPPRLERINEAVCNKLLSM